MRDYSLGGFDKEYVYVLVSSNKYEPAMARYGRRTRTQ